MTTQMLSVNEIHVLSKLENGYNLLWIMDVLGYHDTELLVSGDDASLRVFKGRILNTYDTKEIAMWHKKPNKFRAFRGRVFE